MCKVFVSECVNMRAERSHHYTTAHPNFTIISLLISNIYLEYLAQLKFRQIFNNLELISGISSSKKEEFEHDLQNRTVSPNNPNVECFNIYAHGW